MRPYPSVGIEIKKKTLPFLHFVQSSGLELFTLGSNHIIAQTSHPKTSLNCTFDRFEIIPGAGVNKSKQTLHDGSGGTIALKVD